MRGMKMSHLVEKIADAIEPLVVLTMLITILILIAILIWDSPVSMLSFLFLSSLAIYLIDRFIKV